MSSKRRRRAPRRPDHIPVPEKSAGPSVPATATSDDVTAGRQFKKVSDRITPDMIVYLFWREWRRALDRQDWPFVYDLSADGSALRTEYGVRDEFSEVCRRKLRPVPGIRDAELRRIRLNGPDEAHIVSMYDHRERSQRSFTAERWVALRDADAGWRVHRIDTVRFEKADRTFESVTLDDFPAWVPDAG